MSNLEKSNLEVKNGVKILDQLRTTLQRAPQTAITAPWLRQVEAIHSKPPRLLIGVVGATGSGNHLSSMLC